MTGTKEPTEAQRQREEKHNQAIINKNKFKLVNGPKPFAKCADLGKQYGVGIGLYLQIIAWIRWLLFWLAICMVPFAVVINSARFTTEDHKGDKANPGMAIQPTFNFFQSLTFAIIPDTALDNGLLEWMNIQLPGAQNIYTMSRKTFMIWISMVDAGSMAVCSVACLVLYKLASRFIQAVDDATLEVSDYTVCVKGLPETTPIDIGRHFSKKQGVKVVDVVMIKDVGPLINLAATATNLEQQRKAEAEKALKKGPKAMAAHERKIKKMEKNMTKFMGQASKKLEGSGFGLKAAFVTFDKQSDAEECLASNPKGWFGSFFMRKRDRFLGKYRYYVEPAQPPEDYIYENLSISTTEHYIRMSIVRLVVLCILLASAGAVTKLMAMSMQATTVPFDNTKLYDTVANQMKVHPFNLTTANVTELEKAATAFDTTKSRMFADLGKDDYAVLDNKYDPDVTTVSTVEITYSDSGSSSHSFPDPDLQGLPNPPAGIPTGSPPTDNSTAANTSIADALSQYEVVTYCSYNLENLCSTEYSRLLDADIRFEAGARANWTSLVDSLLKRQAFLEKLKACSVQGSDCYHLAMCQPCHCNMLARVATASKYSGDVEWLTAMQQECGSFMLAIDTNAAAIKGVISFILVILNFLLKAVLHWLIGVEKHITQSDQERAYAVSAFVSQLLNSVLVLLLVNARSQEASKMINDSISGSSASKLTSLGTGLILSGPFEDVSPAWYVQVGQSLQLLIIINSAVTAGVTIAMWLKRKAQQYFVGHCMKDASQATWNAAWLGMQFVLDSRVSDLLLGIWIVMMFGSGIPSLYIWGLIWLIVVEIADRWNLTRLCQTPSRYGESLPFLLLSVLPWAVATHCAFGLWMHTRFNAGYVGGDEMASITSQAGSDAESVSNSVYYQRVTQANGLPLLVLLIIHLALHSFIKFMLYFFSAAFMAMIKFLRGLVVRCCCNKQADHEEMPEPETTYEAALLAMYAQSTTKRKSDEDAAHDKDAVTPLSGAPTYRLPHHPRYVEIFSNPMYKPIWFKAFGRLRYTTLVSRPGGGFLVSPQPILAHDQTDMEQSLSTMSGELKEMLLKMADDSGEGNGKLKRHTGLSDNELRLSQQRSLPVKVAVLAGVGFEASDDTDGSGTIIVPAQAAAQAMSRFAPVTAAAEGADPRSSPDLQSMASAPLPSGTSAASGDVQSPQQVAQQPAQAPADGESPDGVRQQADLAAAQAVVDANKVQGPSATREHPC